MASLTRIEVLLSLGMITTNPCDFLYWKNHLREFFLQASGKEFVLTKESCAVLVLSEKLFLCWCYVCPTVKLAAPCKIETS